MRRRRGTGRRSPVGPAWDAWRSGDPSLARARASALLAEGGVGDEARHVLVLAGCALGDHDLAVTAHEAISPRYRRRAELAEPVLCSHVHRDDLTGAMAFARRSGLARHRAIADRLRLALESPLDVGIEGVAELPFTDDALTPFMPGLACTLNGDPAVARLDTGGSFLHLSGEAAAAHRVRTVASERAFAALSRHTIRHGVADLELGPVRLDNVPVAVHDDGLPAGAIADAFGVGLGPIIGTNILQRFLATIDAPGHRLLLSGRGDAAARRAHLALVGPADHEMPFLLWDDHLMIARGGVGDVGDVNLFVDSGLVVHTADQGQAALLAPRRTLASWSVPRPAPGRLAPLPDPLTLGSASRTGTTAFPVSNRTWRGFGDWGGIRVDALLSWGFLKHFSWTVDTDRRRYLLSSPTA